jgi:hypothetical protein
MQTTMVSEFKSKCIASVKGVAKQYRRISHTTCDRHVAAVLSRKPVMPRRVLGAMRGTVRIRGDIVHGDSSGDWEMVSKSARLD